MNIPNTHCIDIEKCSRAPFVPYLLRSHFAFGASVQMQRQVNRNTEQIIATAATL